MEFHILLRPGETVTTETLRVERTAKPMEAIDRFAKDKAATYGSRVSRIPSVFCTWYYYGLTVTWQDVLTNLERMEQERLPFDVFQIDEGWEMTLGQWEPNTKFPLHMRDAAPGDTVAFAPIPPHSAALIKVERLGDQPVVIASDMHFAMGGEFERLEMKNGRLDYKLKAAYDYPGQYSVWLPDGRVEKLSLMSAAVSASAAH